MNILLVLKIFSAIATIVVGLASLVKPTSIYGFTGLQATGPRGITEIRSILGGVFIGLGAAPFLLQMSAAAFAASAEIFGAILKAASLKNAMSPSGWVIAANQYNIRSAIWHQCLASAGSIVSGKRCVS